jgi:hypothetical protein
MSEVDMPICQITCKDHKVSTPDKTLTNDKIMPVRPVVNWFQKGPWQATKLPQATLRQVLLCILETDPHCHNISSTWQSQSKLPKRLPSGHTFVTADVDKCFDSLNHQRAYASIAFAVDLAYNINHNKHMNVCAGHKPKATWSGAQYDATNPLPFDPAKIKALQWHFLSSGYCIGPLGASTPMCIVDICCSQDPRTPSYPTHCSDTRPDHQNALPGRHINVH